MSSIKSMLSKQENLWSILLICERIFYIYCDYYGREKDELRALLDELWTVDLEKEIYSESDVTEIQSFISSLYPQNGIGSEYIGTGFIVAMVDIYDYIVSNDGVYVASIKEQALDSIKHYLEYKIFENEDSPKEITSEEKNIIENSPLLQKERFYQHSFEIEIKTKVMEEVKKSYIYNPIE